MNNAKPIFDPATHYRIEVQGRVDVDWLKSASLVEIIVDEARQIEGITVLDVNTDQSGIVGLVRRLHSLGMTILQLQIVPGGGTAAQAKEQHHRPPGRTSQPLPHQRQERG